jgi:hypothetical protein
VPRRRALAFDESFEFISLPIDCLCFEIRFDFRDCSPCGDEFVVFSRQHEQIDVADAIRLSACDAAKANDASNR